MNSSAGSRSVDAKLDTSGALWKTHLRQDETLLWTGQPDRSRTILPALLFVAFFGAIAAFYGWFWLAYDGLTEACGDEPRKSCRQIYFMAAPTTVFMTGLVSCFCYHFFRIFNGQRVLTYGITDKRAFSLRHGRINWFASVDLDALDPKDIAVQRSLRRLQFGPKRNDTLTFACLSDADIDQATFAALHRTALATWRPGAALEAALSHTGRPPRRPMYYVQ